MEAGVRLWIMENRPLRKISSELIWFEPFIVVLGKGIVKTAAWGLMWRVILGTFLSMGDLITDILVLKEFWEGEYLSHLPPSPERGEYQGAVAV